MILTTNHSLGTIYNIEIKWVIRGIMRYISVWLLVAMSLWSISYASPLDTIKEKTKDIGKQTPIDVALYAKNPSHKCSLTITNITNPYKKDLKKSLLPPIALDKGRYYRKDISNILKGAYEFEYKWEKNGRFVDASLKSVSLFAYHNTRNKIHKKLNLTFFILAPAACR